MSLLSAELSIDGFEDGTEVDSLLAESVGQNDNVTINQIEEDESTWLGSEIQTTQDHTVSDGWLNVWIARDEVKPDSTHLHLAIEEFERETSNTQRAELNKLQVEFEELLQDCLKAKEKRYPISDGKRSLGAKIFDVVSQQAPEYTAAAWGAVKLLLLLSVNNEKLKQNVATHLKEIAEQYRLLKGISYIHPQKHIIAAVTSTYKDFLDFLKGALKYYREGRLKKLVKNFGLPWDVRFQKQVEDIKRGIAKAIEFAQISSMLIVKRIEAGSTSIHGLVQENVQISREHRNMGRDTLDAVRQILMHQMEGGKDMNELIAKFNIFSHGISDSKHVADAQSSIWRPELLESLLQNQIGDVSDLINDDDIPVQYLCDFLGPRKDNFRLFQDDVFPDMQLLDDSANELVKRYEFAAVSVGAESSTGTHNLQRSDEVLSWIESVQSGLLWIDGHCEHTRLDWTTNFSLEVQALASSEESVTTLSFYCGERNLQEKLTSPVHILRSFLCQLIRQNKKCFGTKPCIDKKLKKERFSAAAADFGKLWLLLSDCLEICRPQCVYIIIDNIDSLHSRCLQNQDDDLHNFLKLIEGLAQADEPISKILVTSRVPGVSSCLFRTGETPSRPVRPDNHTLVKILRQEQHKPNLMRKRRPIYRFPKKDSIAVCGSAEARHIYNSILAGRYNSTDESKHSGKDQETERNNESSSNDDSDFPGPFAKDFRHFLESSDESAAKGGDRAQSTGSSDSDDSQLNPHGKKLMAQLKDRQTHQTVKLYDFREISEDERGSDPAVWEDPRSEDDDPDDSDGAPIFVMPKYEKPAPEVATKPLSMQDILKKGSDSE